MSTDLATVIADLEHKRAVIDTAIMALRAVAVNSSDPAPPPPPRASRGSRPSSKGRRPNAEERHPLEAGAPTTRDARQAAARTQYERGDLVNAIAKAAGVSASLIYGWSSKGKWKRRHGPGVKATVPAQTPAGTRLSGGARCAHCQSMTDYDPCEHCHRTLSRAKW